MEQTDAPRKWAFEYGDPDAVASGEILRTVVGSGAQGIAIEGTDDHDEMGVYIPPASHVLGVRRHRDDYIARTQPEGARSGPGDVDLVVYSLAKFLRLALKGNPTVLVPLFAPPESVLLETRAGREMREQRSWFLSKLAVERFLGYMDSQHERMMGGGKRNRVPNRPELIEAHGWDVKYGSHALRLAYQGWAIAATGTLPVPLPPTIRDRVLAVKRGEVARDDVSYEIRDYRDKIVNRLERNALAVPDEPVYDRIEAWAVAVQREHWGWSRR